MAALRRGGKSTPRPRAAKVAKSATAADAGRVITPEALRAFWCERQGLGRTRLESVQSVLRAGGWMYSPGAAGPYVALRARVAAMTRAGVDRSLHSTGSVAEALSVRGCAMLVPPAERALSLAAAQLAFAARFEKLRTVCRVTDKELGKLAAAVRDALAAGEASPDEIRRKVPAKLVRDLGPAGRKFGEGSTLPAALRHLQLQGEVERRSQGGRLDTSRFVYRLLTPNAFAGFETPAMPADLHRTLAARFFRWAAPATVAEFAFWADVPRRDADAARQALELVAVRVEGEADMRWCFADDRPALATVWPAGRTVFLPFRDNYLYLRRGLLPFLSPEHAGVRSLDWMNRPTTLGEVESLHHHVIVHDGRLVGLWEWDAAKQQVAWGLFPKAPPALRKAAATAAVDLEQFVLADLGDVSFYAFDAAAKRRERVAAVRALRG
jgi:hypothetical protein